MRQQKEQQKPSKLKKITNIIQQQSVKFIKIVTY